MTARRRALDRLRAWHPPRPALPRTATARKLAAPRETHRSRSRPVRGGRGRPKPRRASPRQNVIVAVIVSL
ncbi:hypothetical protein D0U02_28375 [Burkholderia pseudomallei]|uniref:Uncharacterized protein n=1 Tax=Burkholderia pseudomallei TaxID=28450 RepID=A0AAX0U1B5_BURPE|nr:hypothetical protein BPC006_I1063 [Burkholderia pseudomallei BPC006]ARL51413.1 hypothetical protein BOC51_16735 [Burkholderia pseudomallei]AUL56184.1 hypothetical protein BHT10_10090 [Burkholderia pseudomallei]AYX05698.1 hypothetical protein EGY14_17460 [Burkholderia pseudomallei]AYX35676.1 hypothetical protein EGY15_11370 [Burkholderia pseudomallei]